MILNTIIVLLITFVIFVYFYVRKKFEYWNDKNVLHIKPEFPYGNLKGIGRTTHTAFVSKKIYDEFVGRDLLAGLYFFTRPVYFILDPELIKKVLVKDFNYFTNRGIYHNEKDDPLSGNLLSLEGSKWKNLRAKLTPTFTSGKMKMMLNTVLTVAEEFKSYLRPIADAGDEIEIKDILARFTTDIIGTCAFGIDCNSIKNPKAEFRVMGRKVFDPPAIQQIINLFASSFPNLSKKIGIKLFDSAVSEFFLRIVEETIDYRETNNVKRNDFMELLLQLKNSENSEDQLTFNEIAAQSFLFFLGGFETSSTTLTYCLYELAKNIDVQDKARFEIERCLVKHNGKISYEALLEMPYSDRIINESLRKYPPAVVIMRTAGKDYVVEGTSHTIKKGLFVSLPVYAIHHDPKIYPNPNKFDPDRFTAENIKSRHPFTYLPFGEGPRNCIGQRFAIMQARVALITLLLNYKFTPNDKTPTEIEFSNSAPMLTPKNGIFLNIENIKNKINILKTNRLTR